MGLYFPGYATGGMDWVLDLGATDPTYVLPVLTAASMMVSVALPLALVRRGLLLCRWSTWDVLESFVAWPAI